MKSNLIPVSIGEILDKYSILEIKKEKITDIDKIQLVKYEISQLQSIFDEYVNEVIDKYKLLKKYNSEQWNIQNKIRELYYSKNLTDEFIYYACEEFKVNEFRFKIKNEINQYFNSEINEVKEYFNKRIEKPEDRGTQDNKDFVLYITSRGIGDHMRFSTLPKRCFEAGMNFYLSIHNKYGENDLFDLVWKHNPYIKGVSDKPIDQLREFTGTDYISQCKKNNFDSENGFLENTELLFNFKPTSKSPLLYYQPKLHDFFVNKIVVDLAAHTLIYHYTNDAEYFYPILIRELENYPTDSLIFIKVDGYDNLYNHPYFTKFSNSQFYYSNSKCEAADIVFSCKKFICLFSGISAIACALNKESITIVNKNDYNYFSKCHNNWLFQPTKYVLFDSKYPE